MSDGEGDSDSDGVGRAHEVSGGKGDGPSNGMGQARGVSDGEGDKDSDSDRLPRARRRRYESFSVSNQRGIIIKWDLG